LDASTLPSTTIFILFENSLVGIGAPLAVLLASTSGSSLTFRQKGGVVQERRTLPMKKLEDARVARR
jgi:hypothetical protein